MTGPREPNSPDSVSEGGSPGDDDRTLVKPPRGDEAPTLADPATGRDRPPVRGTGASALSRPAVSSTEGRFTPGAVVAGRYRIVGLLGRGGMGEVYRADDLKLGQPVALKFLPPHLEKDSERLALLFHEVKIARQITHPNVCRVYDLGEADGVYFLSMEYIDGEDLSSLLRRIGRLPWGKALETARQVAAGLAAAHEAGILHRDLKPANLMIDGQGQARVTDFGLAALSDTVHGPAVRSGTPAYMAPEQLAGREVTVRSDIYALGLVLYELFTGERAFAADSVTASSLSRPVATPAPPSTLRDGFDPAVERLLLRCLAPEPANRPASVSEIVAGLTVAEEPEPEGAQLRAVVISRLLDRELLVEKLGDQSGAELLKAHDRLARELVARHGGREISRADGFVLLFHRPWEAVRWALDYHAGLRDLVPGDGIELAAQVGIHLGEVLLRRNPPEEVAIGAQPLAIEGVARPMAERLASLAAAGQTLMTRAAFDLARRSAVGEVEDADKVSWLAHGGYLFRGAEEPVDVFEVGIESRAPLVAPEPSGDTVRAVSEETILGWRPAPGLAIPHRSNWLVDEKLGEGGFGEVWLASHAKTRERRVYKFCYEADRLRSLQREITVFRLLKEELGERDDIARLLDWNLDEPPYFIEFGYTEAGSLAEWAEGRGGIEAVPMEERLEIAAQVATALDAAHSVGVLHKDIKPGNILISESAQGGPQALLTDFGIGLVTDRERLAARGITVMGVTEMDSVLEGKTSEGTQLYMPPELLAGRAPTTQSDIYALGVTLYQMAASDLEKPLAPGWERDVEDDLLRADIARMVDGVPARRPRSAADVAEDLRRLEERRAEIEARRRAEEDAQKARRRRRALTVVAASSTVFLLVVSVLAWQALRARAEAERRRAQAEQLIDFMLVDLHEGLERIGRLDLLDQVARGSQEYFDSLSARDESAEVTQQRGITQIYIGDVLLDGGDTEAAAAAYRSALEHFGAAAEREPGRAEWQAGRSQSRVRLAAVRSRQGHTAEALSSLEAALEEAERLRAENPESARRRHAVALARHEIAEVQREAGDAGAAIDGYRQAIALAEELTSPGVEADWRYYLVLLDSHVGLGMSLRHQQRNAEALETFAAARRLAERLVAEDPANAAWPRRLASIHYSIGFLRYIESEWEPALEAFGAARAAYEGLIRTDPTRVEWPVQLAKTYRNLGLVYSFSGNHRAALDACRAGIEIQQGLVAADPADMSLVVGLARLHQGTALAQSELGALDEALEAAVRAHGLREQVAAAAGDAPGPLSEVAWSHGFIGDLQARRGDLAAARERWARALAVIEPITASSDEPMYRDTHAQALLKLGRLEEARPLVESLLASGWRDLVFLRTVEASGLDVDGR